MSHSTPKDQTGPAVIISTVLHVVVLWGLFATSEASSLPLGNDLKGDPTYIELAVASAPKQVKAVDKIEKADDGFLTKEEKSRAEARPESSPSPEDARLGNKDGTTAAGVLGDTNGFEATARERYLYELLTLLNGRKQYPLVARRLGETGRVVVEFKVLPDGTIQDPQVAIGCLFDRLNKAAVELVKGIGKFKPLPEDLIAVASNGGYLIKVPIEYVLN